MVPNIGFWYRIEVHKIYNLGGCMVKRIIMSSIIFLLIPTCIGVYYILFKELQEIGSPVLNKEEARMPISKVTSNEDENNSVEMNDQKITDKNKITGTNEALLDNFEEANGEEPYSPGEPMDDIDYETVQKEMEELDQEASEDNPRVKFITKDEEGNIIEERYEPLESEHIIEPNSDRHLEILAEQFVKMHFDPAGINVAYSGKLVSRDNQYAKVTVLKNDWRASFNKEKFNVILAIHDGRAEPISFQQVDI
jgi:hypothetical protein